MEHLREERLKILVTGSAGFIGSAVASLLASRGHTVIGIDNLNSYYDPALKIARLQRDGISVGPDLPPATGRFHSQTYPTLSFIRMDITDSGSLQKLWEEEHFDVCVNLAAQAGVRYSLENPRSYVDNNVGGFINILECGRRYGCGHVVYASSSSVYGSNTKVPFSEEDAVENPVSVYAATKRADELIAKVYAGLYGLPMTGLRFFTVYGPWGRPDMAPMIFTEAIMSGRSIRLFNYGNMSRDFTYIDDIAEGVVLVAESTPQRGTCEIFNIGHGHPTQLSSFISKLEQALGREAVKELVGMQPGDVERTWADTTRLRKRFGYAPTTDVETGVRKLADWYCHY